MMDSGTGTRRGNMFGLLQNILVILLLLGVVYFFLTVMNKKSSQGGKSEKSVIEGARDNVDRINAQTKAREDQINEVFKEQKPPPR